MKILFFVQSMYQINNVQKLDKSVLASVAVFSNNVQDMKSKMTPETQEMIQEMIQESLPFNPIRACKFIWDCPNHEHCCDFLFGKFCCSPTKKLQEPVPFPIPVEIPKK